jgi:ATP-dependent RNA helicase SUPV3L1/SUV3
MTDRPAGAAPSRLVAVLGPTNTGKTHLAVERMLGHASGMIGLPLRLLAREIYDRIVKLRGARAVALVTGEEKIVPPRPHYWVCTVEAMPLSQAVEFLAVDEIQLCADPERGHVFTSRLLHARGIFETMFLGASTMAPLIRRLLPEAEIQTRERYSTLSYAGSKKLTRLPRRTAVVAFSAEQVYAIAELIRRQRGQPVAAHPQRPGGPLSERRGRFPGGHRRHRHGPEHGRGSCRLLGPAQVRRQAHAVALSARGGPDRRPRRPIQA